MRTKRPHEATSFFKVGFDDSSLVPEVPEATKEGRTPSPCCQQCQKQDDRVDAEPAFAGPIGIGVEAQPQGEFIERESCAHPITDGHEAAEEDGLRGMVPAQVEKPPVANH